MHKFIASDGRAGDKFGLGVASHGNIVVIGAAAGGNGAAYVFNMDTKAQMHKLMATDGGYDHCFGTGTAIYGNTIMVSAGYYDNGAVYTFDAISGDQLQKFTNTDSPSSLAFGYSHALAIHNSTNVGIVGHGYEDQGGMKTAAGAVYVFHLDTGAQIRKIIPAVSAAEMYFGSSLFVFGDYLLIGAPGADSNKGRVYVFDIKANWTETAFFGPSDNETAGQFGMTIASSGSRFIVSAWKHNGGASGNGALYMGYMSAGEKSKLIPMR